MRYKVITILLLFLCLSILEAQPSGGGPGGGGPPNNVPISGIGYLLAGGALIGIRKLMQSRKKTID